MANTKLAKYNVDEFFYNDTFVDYATCRGVSYVIPPPRSNSLIELLIEMSNGCRDFYLNAHDLGRQIPHIGLCTEFINCKLMLVRTPVFAIHTLRDEEFRQEVHAVEERQMNFDEHHINHIHPWPSGNFLLYSVRLLTNTIYDFHDYTLCVRGTWLNDEQWKFVNGDIFKR